MDLSAPLVTNVCPQCGQEWELYASDVAIEEGGGYEKRTKCCDIRVEWSPCPFRRNYERHD
jgi:hypothetical protein